ncbi:MAG: PEP-CTERM sorting domain-containing protein [Armatimonadetes bacterium]|nr:PEP-CTERM sorting domain-containing protein [Armatimonadota bacterium]
MVSLYDGTEIKAWFGILHTWVSPVHYRFAIAGVILLAVSLPATADILWDQPVGAMPAIISTRNNVFPTRSAYGFDDFEVNSGGWWEVDKVTLYGAGGLLPNSVHLAFPSAPNASAITTTYPGTVVGGNLEFNLGGMKFYSGHYWLSGFIVRGGQGSSNWTWKTRQQALLDPAWWHNPGNYYGLGTNPLPISTLLDLEEEEGDFAFRIEGKDVPEPGTFALLGLGLAGLSVYRRRKTS